MSSSQATCRLTALRQLMQKHQLDYYYVPGTDAHNNEYVPDCWQRRVWVSEFTGSAGDVLVGLDQAYLWTDPRYFLQAEQELDGHVFSLMKMQQGTASTEILAWLVEHAQGLRVGVDPKLMAIAVAQRWLETLSEHDIELVAIAENLVDVVWEDQPPLTPQEIKLHPVSLAGETVSNKLLRVRSALKAQDVQVHVISMLDAICWLFNIRGQDVEFNPLVISYAVVTQTSATLYMDVTVLTDEQKGYFQECQVEVQPYDAVELQWLKLQGNVLLDQHTASWWMFASVAHTNVQLGISPITLMKACKNPIEVQGAIDAHELDAVALVRFWIWLEQNWQGQTEVSLADHLEAIRHQSSACQGLSFATIAGFAEHGAIIHYRAEDKSALTITDQSLLLLDSGGQYSSGTTDITRVFHLGSPTDQQKQHYTLVLQGHLALANTVFPSGTTGEHLNAIAHRPIWQAYCDFSHGTGHGVGSYLCVHEGPQRISQAHSGVLLQPGMILSNEPGLYIEGLYGIRIENLCYVKEVCSSDDSPTQHGPFYQFEDLTLVPYDLDLINTAMLSPQEVVAVNQYHQRVYDKIAPYLTSEEVEWLSQKTQPIAC